MKVAALIVLALTFAGESALAQGRSLYDLFYVTQFGEDGKITPTDLTELARAIRGKDFSQYPTNSYRFNKTRPSAFGTDSVLDHQSPVFGLIGKCEPDALAMLSNQKANLREAFLVYKDPGYGFTRRFINSGTTDDNKNMVDGQEIVINEATEKSLRSYGQISTYAKGKVVSTIHFEFSLAPDEAHREIQKLLNGEAIEAREVMNRINPTLITALDYARFLRDQPLLQFRQNGDQNCMDRIIRFLEKEKVPTGEELLENDPQYAQMKGGIETRRRVNLSLFGATPIFRGTSENAVNSSDRNLLKEASDLINHIDESSKISDQ